MKTRTLRIAAAATLLIVGALASAGISNRKASSEQIDDWRMQAMSDRSGFAVWRLEFAKAFGNRAARFALAQLLISDIDASNSRRGLALLRQVAGEGDARAELQLGRILLRGQSAVPADFGESRVWLLKAAASKAPSIGVTDAPGPNDAPSGYAAYYLASIYRNGYGVRRDPRVAFDWLKRAAQAGVPQAQFQLANAYRQDGVVPRDDTMALYWLTLAGQAELAEANLALAIAYRNGELGLKADDNQYWEYVKETAHDYKHTIRQ